MHVPAPELQPCPGATTLPQSYNPAPELQPYSPARPAGAFQVGLLLDDGKVRAPGSGGPGP